MSLTLPQANKLFTNWYDTPPAPERFLKDFAEVSRRYERHHLERQSLLDHKETIEAKPPRKGNGWRLGGIMFASKEDAIEGLRFVRSNWQPGEIITGSDADFLSDLFVTHQYYEDKVGVGVKNFFMSFAVTSIDGEDDRNSRVVGFERNDGTWDDIGQGYLCHKSRRDGAPVALETEDQRWKSYFRWRFAMLCTAFRLAVGDQIGAFKERQVKPDGTWICEITGEVIDSRSSASVDHAPPNIFHNLVVGFMREKGWGVSQFDIVDRFGGEAILANPYDAAEWQAYHHERAELRIVKKGLNSSAGAWGVDLFEPFWGNLPDATPWRGGRRYNLIPDFKARAAGGGA